MAFSIEELGKIDHIVGDWCIRRVPPEIKNELDHDYEVDGQAVTLLKFSCCGVVSPENSQDVRTRNFGMSKQADLGRFAGGGPVESSKRTSLIL